MESQSCPVNVVQYGSSSSEMDIWNPRREEGRFSDQEAPPQLSSFQKLVEGQEQTIHIPMKDILIGVMKKMPEKKEPVFRCISHGPDRFQVSVELNVSGSRVTVEPNVHVITIMGDIAASQQLSEFSAVSKAFDYIEGKHFVHVSDYSSEVVDEYEENRVWRDVNSVGYTLEKVLAEWSMLINKIENFQLELERNETIEKTRGVRSASGDIYAECMSFVGPLVTRYREKHRANESEFKGYDASRCKHIRQSNDKVAGFRMKAARQFVSFALKDVLGCVLNQLGLRAAEYSNEPAPRGEFTGEVMIQLPDIEDARCGGRTKFRGGMCLTAAEAEEAAAHKALSFIESRLKVTIVDMNYNEKVEAQATHHSMVKLLRDLIRLAGNVEKDWGNMKDYMDAGADIFGWHTMRTTIPSNVVLAAMKFCEETMAKLRAETDRAYKDAVEKLQEMEKYYPSNVDYDD